MATSRSLLDCTSVSFRAPKPVLPMSVQGRRQPFPRNREEAKKIRNIEPPLDGRQFWAAHLRIARYATALERYNGAIPRPTALAAAFTAGRAPRYLFGNPRR